MKRTVKVKQMICVCFVMLMALSFFSVNPLRAEASAKFKVSSTSLKKSLNNYSIRVNVDNKEQRFVIKKKEISKVTVKSKKFSSDRKSVTVTAFVYVDRKVATVKARATIKYSLKKNKWKLSSVNISKASISSIPLRGTWTGTYVANQGQTKAVFVINSVSKDGYAAGILYFSGTPTNPKVPSGSYTVVGGYDKKTGKVSFTGDEWISQPSGYTMVDFYGYLDLKNKEIREDNYSLSISKE